MKQHICLCMLILACMTTFSTESVEAAIPCYGCHGTYIPIDYRPVDSSFRNPSSGGFPGNHSTHMGAPATTVACGICHPGSSSYNASHRNGLIKVSSRINSSPLTTPYNHNTSSFPQTATPTPGSCSGVNCHFETDTPVWGSATFTSATDCSKCHGAAPADGTHPKHAAYYGFPATTNSCLKCHADHTADSNPFAHATSAGKRGLVVSFEAAPNNGFGRYTGNLSYPNYLPSQNQARNGVCKNLYCHSPGTKAVNPEPPNITAVWGGNLACTGCHSADLASGSYIATGSHKAHVYGGVSAFAVISCVKCHAATVTADTAVSDTARHVNKQVEVAFINSSSASNGSYNGFAAKPSSPSTKTPGSIYANCENIYCHSTGQGEGGSWPPIYTMPTWGNADTGKCGTCHGVDGKSKHANYTSVIQRRISSGSHTKHLTYTFGINSHAFICVACHAYNKTDAIESADSGCNIRACHQGALTTALKHSNYEINVDIPDYFGPSAGYNGTTKPGHDGNGYNGSTCTSIYCHSDGTSVATDIIPVNTSNKWGSGALACSGCHGNPPSYSDGSPKNNSHGIHWAYSCNKCHYRTTTNGTSITNTANHVNKAYDIYSGAGAGFTYAFSTSGGTCTNISCHGSTTAQWGSTACLGCHSVSQGNRAAITGQFGANSHHIQGTLTDARCYQCHWEANSDGKINPLYHGGATAPGSTVDLVVYGAGRPASYSLTDTVTAVQYTADNTRGEIAKINTHCLGCHSTVNNAAQPFGDGKTPKQYAWDGSSVAARYSNSNGTQWGKYATNGKSAVSKAFSAHGNAVGNAGGFSPANGVDGAITNTRAGINNVYCFDCHNSHGSTILGTTTSYASATTNGGILKDTIAGKGGYALAYKPYSGGSAANKNKRNPGASLCFDCHMTPDATAGAKPWGYTSTFGASQAIIGYWDTSYFGAGQFPSQARFNYKNSVNMGGHYGQSGTLSAQASKAIGGLCTPCHDPHGVSTTLGTNMQYAVPLLKGTFLTSPYNEDLAPAINSIRTAADNAIEYHIDQNTFASDITLGAVSGIQETESQFAGLCLQCHGKTGLTNGTNGGTWKSVDRIHESVKDWGLNGKHQYSCSKCHTPHNSRLPKLMVSNCFDYKHKGRVANNMSPVTSGSWNGCNRYDYSYDNDEDDYWGCGQTLCTNSWGNMPGSYSQNPPDWEIAGVPQHSNRTVICHQGQAADQKWNEKTRW